MAGTVTRTSYAAACAGKHAFPSFCLAQKQVARAARNGAGTHKECKITVYSCRFCGGFHIGHKGRNTLT